ncbi:uncharacterized protein LOC108004371 [Apis cerana]|uniref:uncharacterized protein LOC108004371 n=1 Tax=Apis cerana TaxID=7461 RepID=UPI0007E2B14B|nr:uncharacterized protein LOC108004371 [Apis cerana]XP_061935239.1 uncharacterized protein LOC108004371 [Apis cerana]
MLLSIKVSGTLLLFLCSSSIGIEFEDHFKDCHPNVSDFDECIQRALNEIRPYFKTGVSKYGAHIPFEPFFIKKARTSRGTPNFGFVITMNNIEEVGWDLSKVTKFTSDLKNYKVVYTQNFPDKRLKGAYEFKGSTLNFTMNNRGTFMLQLYDFVQTTTVIAKPGARVYVKVEINSVKDMKLHITNLFFGIKFIENIVDIVINSMWKQLFKISAPIVNELISDGYFELFDSTFRNFPFEKIIKPYPYTN